ncbi:trehalose-phosphatase [candidate division WOR-1 bacterium RIFOXYA12_FULL_43_27]|uniref:Trehalose 6-phosphate phosphatase n=1 Tax=candidate division WOR-1 bacterium RIFOXYC2_FULL_46_14 TaxID=1802587 RepID=A0A1F4U831_UNCSA|nr:MAG: trehalose-phosphatase [candidate division WOR-1 bacterium RIFOXYA12_FULL_43_27]OGC19462.1 MAG: trehalose-phosphatase [candidate division WOR-1 bacterium RIFOXYB2_FULL_46_45]OGC30450.1 MAG: trehalose-phosphatase [candidate division WOR-1 bacterium RIFOXYA2_FULL_46_56]OGC41051.1 MAG: trehalose-phosphatase [candidate division WOR-1 bacterium RIFOXYC2_FULL_46_14]
MKLLLFLDYDGTLTPIVSDPMCAKLSPSRRKLLNKLSRHPKIKLVIISGRKLSVVRKLAGIGGIIYAGNHGLEILIGKSYWVHPSAEKFSPLLKKLSGELGRKLLFRGVLVENKGLSISAHYRSLARKYFPAFKKEFERVIKPWKGKIKITRGKKVFEIRPPIKWDKGKAVKRIIGKLKPGDYWPVYIGDDRTDEDAFRALKRKGLTVHVGDGKTAAKKRVRDISAVYRYLRGLIKK